METEAIIRLLKQTEKEYYLELTELSLVFGNNYPGTNLVRAKWSAVRDLIEQLNLNEDE